MSPNPLFKSTYGESVELIHLIIFKKALSILVEKYSGRRICVIDIGCGRGEPLKWFCSLLSENEIKVNPVGLDLHEEFKLNLSKAGIEFYEINMNYEKLPFSDNSIEVVVATEILEHLFIPENLITEAYRVLKPYGIFILTTPNLRWYVNVVLILLGYNPFIPDTGSKRNYGMLSETEVSGHIRAYTVKAIKSLLSDYNFRIIKIVGIPHPYKKTGLKRLIGLIDRGISRIIPSLSYDIGVICEVNKKYEFANDIYHNSNVQ